MTRITGGKLTVAKRESDGCNIASEHFATYPVRLQVTSRPNNDQRTAVPKPLRCYILDYGGGLVSGDVIRLQFHVQSGASATITSQSTSKAFKSVTGRPDTYLRTDVTVEDRALLALVPQPIQCYNQAKLRQETNLTLTYSGTDNNSAPSLIYIDWYTGGRPNLDSGIWQLQSFHTSTELRYLNTDNGKTTTVFKDRTILSGGPDLCRHMRSFNLICLVVLVGPRVSEAAARLSKDFSSRNHYEQSSNRIARSRNNGGSTANNHGIGLNHSDEQLLVSCGSFPLAAGWEGEGVVVRIAAGSMEQAASLLSRYIGDLDGQLEEDPFMDILATHQVLNAPQSTIKVKMSGSDGGAESLSYGLLKSSFDAALVMPKTETGSVTPDHDVDRSNIPPTQPSVPSICLYQLVDSSAPTGGFAHSNTLEAACQLHFINDHYSLLDHAWEVLLQTMTTMIPFLVRSCQLFQAAEASSDWEARLDKWERLDHDLSVTLTSHVSRRASSVQGSGILRAYNGAFPQIAAMIKSLRARVITPSDTSLTGNRGQAATCFGAVCGLLGISPDQSASMFLYTVARDLINAGVRMNLVGPIEGGYLINALCSHASVVLERFLKTNSMLETGCEHQIAPLLDILANAHDRLYSRLFNS